MQSCPELGQGEGDHFDGVEFRTRRLLRGSKRTSLERSETLRHVPNAILVATAFGGWWHA
jgi:hypothetical protein